MAGIQDVMVKLDDVLDKIADNKEKIDEVRSDLNVDRSVQRICMHCGGDGLKTDSSGPDALPCPDCGGNGVIPYGRVTLTSEE